MAARLQRPAHYQQPRPVSGYWHPNGAKVPKSSRQTQKPVLFSVAPVKAHQQFQVQCYSQIWDNSFRRSSAWKGTSVKDIFAAFLVLMKMAPLCWNKIIRVYLLHFRCFPVAQKNNSRIGSACHLHICSAYKIYEHPIGIQTYTHICIYIYTYM